MRIILDPGHGYGIAHNRGAVVGNEGDNNFLYAQVLKKELERYGATVGLTRERQEDDPALDARGKAGKGFDLFISLHSNATNRDSVRGTEIYNSIQRPAPDALVADLCATIAATFGHENRGVKRRPWGGAGDTRDYYAVLRTNEAAAGMLIEHGFHTNATDAAFYVNHRQKIAEATARVIASHYGLKKETGASAPAQGGQSMKQETIYRIQVGAFSIKSNADNFLKKVKQYFPDAFITSTTQSVMVDYAALAKEVIRGDWGNGQARVDSLTKAGYDPAKVQAEVDRQLRG